ncbi:uncharacterized protein LOC123267253 [Cotesia glomerata]|uniref:uncharacterized protein LOC123267253 n=1 Tax=Cotesia glomerata TaxID=32391 RepID=UPI001D00E0CF|nr:uncharacterized protein LOC123267253 [Cotesia glomerata]
MDDNDLSNYESVYQIPLLSNGSCDSSKLKAESSIITDKSGVVIAQPRWKKKYFCIYCHKLVVKLPRHIETKHKDIEEAQQLKNTPKGTQERKKLIEIYRDNGRTLHNTNPKYTGKLLVSRRPKSENKSAEDYITCPKCLKTVLKQMEHTHKFLGRDVEGRVHANARDTLSLVIFPVFQEDAIVRLIRYDWLLVLYGNKLCIKHTAHYQHNLIRAKLRLVGRLLFAAKELNPLVEDLASIFAPEFIDTIVKAIEVVARINRLENDCGAPSSALSLVTYLKHISKIYESEHAKKNYKEGLDRVMRFRKVYKNEMPDSINQIAGEAQSKLKRQKVVLLLMTEDIQKLINYLKAERKKCFKILEHCFNLREWLNGLKFVSAYILVFNRRRVGDIQNILLTDLNKIECIDREADREEFNLLDDTVAVIVGADILKEINIIIRHRLSANVPPKNEYLFGLPNNIDDRVRVVNICKEMRISSIDCGAEKPELLRGTGLRKHVTTKCIELELNDKALGDVINHLGHSEKIHKDFYWQPIKSKTIVQVAKVLEAVQGPLDIEEDEDIVDDVSDFIVIPDIVCEKEANRDFHDFSQPSCSYVMKDSDLNQSSSSTSKSIHVEYDLCNEDHFSGENTANPESNNYDYTEKHQKKRWTQTELGVVFSAFHHHLQAKTLPSLNDIDDLQEKYPCLQGRSRKSIKTWVSNQIKGKPKTSTMALKIIGNQTVQLDVTKYLKKRVQTPIHSQNC